MRTKVKSAITVLLLLTLTVKNTEQTNKTVNVETKSQTTATIQQKQSLQQPVHQALQVPIRQQVRKRLLPVFPAVPPKFLQTAPNCERNIQMVFLKVIRPIRRKWIVTMMDMHVKDRN